MNQSRHTFLATVDRQYGAQLRRFLSARLRNAGADTGDLMQEVYLRLLRVDDYETIRNPQAYLFTIANHVLHQHALRQSVITQGLAAADPASIGPPECDPEQEVEVEQLFGRIGDSLRERSPRAYTVLMLSRCEGLPLKEIGERLGVSRDQIKKYLARALIHVRQKLKEEG